MKTAMQTLISKLKTEISELNKKIDKYSNDTGVYTGHKYGLDQALSVAEELLEMEKHQRQEDTNYGYSQGWDDGNQNKEPMRPGLKQQEQQEQ